MRTRPLAAAREPALARFPGEKRESLRRLRATLLAPVNAHIGLRLRARRLGMGVSEATAAHGLRVSLRAMRAIEAGRRALTLDEIVSAARMLSVPIAYFYCGLSDGEGAAAAAGALLH